VKSQRNPRTSDLAISYSAVGLSYILVGCFGALALPGSSDGNTPEPEPEPESRSLAVVVQVAKALHALTFYPLMTVIYRQQLIGGILRGFGVGKEVRHSYFLRVFSWTPAHSRRSDIDQRNMCYLDRVVATR
jgi:hypothetical protein